MQTRITLKFQYLFGKRACAHLNICQRFLSKYRIDPLFVGWIVRISTAVSSVHALYTNIYVWLGDQQSTPPLVDGQPLEIAAGVLRFSHCESRRPVENSRLIFDKFHASLDRVGRQDRNTLTPPVNRSRIALLDYGPIRRMVLIRRDMVLRKWCFRCSDSIFRFILGCGGCLRAGRVAGRRDCFAGLMIAEVSFVIINLIDFLAWINVRYENER